jgi:hypothetical protein
MSREDELLTELTHAIVERDPRGMFRAARELADLIGWQEADVHVARLLTKLEQTLKDVSQG